jgi:hypothetical protein
MLSATGQGETYLPVNDAHADEMYSPGLVAAYCQITDQPEWRSLYAAMMQAQAAQPTPNLYHFILGPDDMPVAQPLIKPKFAVFPDVGQASSIRHTPNVGFVHVHLCSGPAFWGHFHEDKGSFILEANGEALAIDRGVTNYDHPETNLMGFASRHNLLYPERADGAEVHQPSDVAGALLTSASERDGVVLLASDNVAAWPAGVFDTNIRRVFSPFPTLFIIDDEAVMGEPCAVSFRVNTTCSVRVVEGGFQVDGQRASLRIMPLNWTPANHSADALGIESHLRPVNQLRLLSPEATTHRLLTALEVIPESASAAALRQVALADGAISLRRDALEVRLVSGPSWLEASVMRRGQIQMSAACHAGVWEWGNQRGDQS